MTSDDRKLFFQMQGAHPDVLGHDLRDISGVTSGINHPDSSQTRLRSICYRIFKTSGAKVYKTRSVPPKNPPFRINQPASRFRENWYAWDYKPCLDQDVLFSVNSSYLSPNCDVRTWPLP